jgi:DNA recombination protein RmuC
MEILFLIIGIIIGVFIAWLIVKSKYQNRIGASPEAFEQLKTQIGTLNIENSRVEERSRLTEENLKMITLELSSERAKNTILNADLAALKSNYANLQVKLAEQKEEVEKIQEKFTKEFENLANKIFEDKSSKFTSQNKENLDQILKPLNDKIKDFEKRVEETYDKESKQRFSLENEIRKLSEANIQITKDATNLTNALRGQSKTQGNWGEFILENILEKSGLEKGREYLVQVSMTAESGKRFQPDILVNLPDNKTIVVDSKVSLVAYEKYCSTEDEAIRASALRDHILSIRNHIKELSAKNYHNLYQIQSLDFVLMFMPVEPAFSLAVQFDSGIFNEAFDKNIVIVSPSTLLATLRTIASIWRQENQNKNAIEIAKQSGALYDKFVGFVEDLINVGNKIDVAKVSYTDAMKKLHEGSGNLVSRTEKIRKLGAKTSKSLPQSLLDRTDDNEPDELLS